MLTIEHLWGLCCGSNYCESLISVVLRLNQSVLDLTSARYVLRIEVVGFKSVSPVYPLRVANLIQPKAISDLINLAGAPNENKLLGPCSFVIQLKDLNQCKPVSQNVPSSLLILWLSDPLLPERTH